MDPANAKRRPSGARILVIDDDSEIRRVVRTGLSGADFVVEWAPTAADGMDLVMRWHPDVVLLDLGLPDKDGLEVCRELRTWSSVPIIVLSVRESDSDKITALEFGADDYVTKPFSMGELLARVRVALRHAAHASSPTDDSTRFESGGLMLDFERRIVTVDGAQMHLTPTEYEVLKFLAMNAGKVVTHTTLLHAVWGPAYGGEVHYLRVFIGQLRKKIELEPLRPRYVLTEPGVGYCLRTADTDV